MAHALDIALRFAADGLRESPPGSNRGPVIADMLRSVGAAAGQPWCAAFVSWCFQAASGEAAPFRSASSQAIRRWFESKGMLSRDPSAMLGWRGALFGWTNADRIHGHIGLVRARLVEGGRIVAIGTVEGNTSAKGSRNGDGVYALRRPVLSRRFWFLNCGELPGGAWWAAGG
jgi:hypothetical protein